METVVTPPVSVRNIAISCLCVCPLVYLINHMSKLHYT